ncbi:MAG: hypothetical protein ACJ74H_10100 [Thermoanaerobaculia bacterium]
MARMNAQHERNLHLRARLNDPRVGAQLEVPWRTNGIVAQCFFFVLTCIAIGAFYGLMQIISMPGDGLVAGAASIVLAELLIARRWFFTGVEAALWICGVLALISELPRSGTPESMLVLAAACAIAGARVRNPLFGAVAAIFVMLYCEERLDAGVLCALLIALAACIALLRAWRRPSTEALWIALALVMPIAGRFTADTKWRTVTIALYAIFGGVALVLAIARRHHALFLTAMVALAIAAGDAIERIQAPPEAKCAVAGFVLLAIAFAISRALRDRTHGFVLTPIALTPVDDALELGATLALQPSVPSPAPQPATTGGGNFGGAGASGDY